MDHRLDSLRYLIDSYANGRWIMNWWEGLEDWGITALKENETPLGLLSSFDQEIMQQVDADDLQVYNQGKWGKTETLEGARWLDRAYRLRPDWQRPKEKEDPEKNEEGHWEYCEIFNQTGEWRFIYGSYVRFYLHEAPSIVGFGGIEYEEFPDKWFSDLGVQVFWHDRDATPDHGQIIAGSLPATPKRIRFLVKK